MQSLIDTLRAIPKDDFDRLETLADSIRIRGYDEARTVTSLAMGSDPVLAQKALLVLINLGELAMVPQADSLEARNADAYAKGFTRLTDWHLGAKGRIAAILVKALDDKRPLPPPQLVGAVEGRVRLKRVCDQAYIQLRKLLATEENDTEISLQEKFLLDLPEEKRDFEISKFKQGKSFSNLSEAFPGEG